MPVIKIPLITPDQYAEYEGRRVPHMRVWMDPELSEDANYERLLGILKQGMERAAMPLKSGKRKAQRKK